MSWRSVHWIILIAVLNSLGGCGFKPLYSSNPTSGNGIIQQLSVINIDPIRDRVGQQLRNYLIDILTPTGRPQAPHYVLKVVLEETRSNMVILRDATSTFAKVKIKAHFKLNSLSSNSTLVNKTTESTTVFNIVESEYANITAQHDARRRAVHAIGDNIKLTLALFFGQRDQQPKDTR
ncbi:MAG: hypothetical protein CMM58_02485 [Rhodospirillaceae bacterium]|nr:hypothetical protein [Rhodospirillaceae bacterium]|tara:strand:+ start:541 stop:1074 length:534 start_codon:yes stop_codon:yes gene_type:complete